MSSTVSDFNLDDIKKELNLKEVAINQGRQLEPNEDSLELDNTQQKIVDTFKDLINNSKIETEKNIENSKNRLDEIEIELGEDNFNNILGKYETSLSQQKALYKDDLSTASKNEKKTKREKKAFQRMNELDREAIYPESKLNHWIVIVLLVIFESIANSYFFAKGSDLGLIGGFWQATLVSFANVGTAILIGTLVYPYKNHINHSYYYFSIVVTIVLIIIIIIFNLAISHYRMFLSTDPLNAIIKAIPNLIRDPFGINNFDAIMLLLMGHIFAILAFFKSYNSDDHYPDYGNISRTHEKALNYYQDEKSHLRDFELKKCLDDSIDQVKKTKKHLIAITREYRKTIGAIEIYISNFNDYIIKAEKGANQLLGFYREENEAVRDNNSSPRYFSDGSKDFKITNENIITDLESEKKKADECDINIIDVGNKANITQEKLRERNNEAIDIINIYFTKIDGEIDSDIEKYNNEKT